VLDDGEGIPGEDLVRAALARGDQIGIEIGKQISRLLIGKFPQERVSGLAF
jgi:hypothetical protein